MTDSTTLSEQRRALLQGLLTGEAALRPRPGEIVEPRLPDALVPASAEQTHVWLHAAMAPGAALYNESITIHRSGSFSIEALQRAFNEILRRHEMWRSSLELRDGSLRAVVHSDLRVTLPLIDLTGLPENERDAAAVAIATEDARRPLDLTQAPLLRAKVVRLAPDRHRLYLTLHHIIFDGVAIYRLLMPELTALYAAYERGEEPAPAERRLQYGDYAIWRARQLADKTMARELEYWREKLSGELPELKLPADHRPPSLPTHRGSMETFHLSPELTTSLKAFSRQEGVTLYVTLLTAFKVMLHRYSGQDDIVVGGVTDMRRRSELENVIGYFLNSVALRTRPKAEMSFRDYLREVQRTVVGALDASNLPFDRVVREIRPNRAAARHPLFQVLFSIEPPAPAFAEGWALTQMDVTVGTAKFDLYLELDEERDRIIGRFLYSTDLFEAPTIRRMIGHWKTLLRGALLDPQSVLARLPLLTPEERDELLVKRNATARDFPQTTLHEWFSAQAATTPDAIAVEGDGRRWRYRDLERRATQLAWELRRAGARRGTLVGIAMERSPEMVAGLLGILKTGATYLPLDPGLPAARLGFLIEDARPAVILTDDTGAARLPRCDAPILRCNTVSDPEDCVDDAVADAAITDDLAYVLYTSGSTGRPKAVEIRHRAVVNLLAAMQDELDFGAEDSFLAVTTLSFDIAALELFLPLVTGGRLVVASRDDAADPSRLAALIARSRCSVMQATPATWRGLLARGWPGDPRLKLLCGGEALPPDLAAALLGRCAKLWNVYGPTETTIWSLSHVVKAGDDPMPIGRPLANSQVYILDQNGAPVPDLVPGELVIGGAGMARGYRNDPVLTAQKFVRFVSLGDRPLYRTGDMARYRGDGTIEFLGRTDNQVKIRGFRVGLEEVEAVIAMEPRIAACAVRAVPDASGELGLAAYLIGDRLSESDIPALRNALRETIPDYMVPTNYTILAALPMTPNGKVDRKQLPVPQITRSTEIAEPRDELEAKLVALWKEVLGVPKIGIHDNFFDLGGHSLLASVLVAQMQANLGRELPLVAIFQSPTIAGLAETLRSTSEPSFSHLVPLRESGAGRPLFIVHGIFGNVLQLKDLAERLNTRRPIYALQARGVDPRQEPHSSIAAMVEAYATAIRSVQPIGPYALAGYSFGGLVAFEMARWFRAHGEAVDLLALLETDLYERFLPLPDKIAYRLLLARRVIEKARILRARELPLYFASKLVQLGHRLLLRLGLRDDFVILDGLTGPMGERSRRMYQIGVREFRAFKPKRFDSRLSVFRTKGPRFDACDPLPIWRLAAKSVELFEVEGAHATIMDKPYVETLAAQLARCLAASELPTRPLTGVGRTQAGDTVATFAAELLDNGPDAVWQGGN
jgi:amino acid adenylation domain-containing protein